MVALLVLLTIVLFLTIDYLVQRHARRQPAVEAAEAARAAPAPLADAVGLVPAGVFLAPGHTWLRLESEGTVALGADRLTLTLLGSPTELELPDPGTKVRRGDTLAVLRRGNRALCLRSPVDGTIEAVNGDWRTDRSCDPFGTGWILRLAPVNLAAALKRMFVAEEATAWMRDELRRLRDLVTALPAPAEALATLPDGGLPVVGLAAELDERSWNDLAERFLREVEPVR